MMQEEDKIVIFKAKFSEFSRSSNAFVASIPANKDDEFCITVGKSSLNEIGFNKSNNLLQTHLKIFENCVAIDYLKSSKIISDKINNKLDLSIINFPFGLNIVRFIFLKIKDNYEWENEIKRCDAYMLALKKEKVFERFGKSFELPEKPKSYDLLNDKKNITFESYNHINDYCNYVSFHSSAGEYGQGSFVTWSRNLDIYLSDLHEAARGLCQIVEVKSARELPMM